MRKGVAAAPIAGEAAAPGLSAIFRRIASPARLSARKPPSAGAIWFDDRRIDGLAPGARDVAMVFQSYALYPHLDVRENIGFPLRARGVRGTEAAREVERVAPDKGFFKPPVHRARTPHLCDGSTFNLYPNLQVSFNPVQGNIDCLTGHCRFPFYTLVCLSFSLSGAAAAAIPL